MKTDAPKIVKLNEYKKPNYMVQTIDLVVHLDNTETLIQSKMKIKKNAWKNCLKQIHGTSKNVALNNYCKLNGICYPNLSEKKIGCREGNFLRSGEILSIINNLNIE